MWTNKLIINFFTLFSPLLLTAQKELILTGTVIDSVNKMPLAYVNIGVVGTSIGTVSNAVGTFQLHLTTEIDEAQIVRFSFIGYETKEYTIASLQLLNGKNIQLAPTAIKLETVEVRPNLLKSKNVGHTKTKTRMNTNFAIGQKPGQNLGASIGRRFNLGKELHQLATFRFFVAANNFDTTRFRINVFNIKRGRPNELVHSSPIIVTLKKQQQGWIEVDLVAQQIFVESDVIVAVEWIEYSQKGNALGLPITIPTLGTHFYKYGSQNRWKRFRGMSTAMELTVKK
ncbi:MAG: carboxypeptidase-like regulatory domain-containing protein [Bacteroidota bacterium]